MLWTPKQENKRNPRSPSEIEKYGSVFVQTEKTYSTRVIRVEDYKRWVSDHILKSAELTL